MADVEVTQELRQIYRDHEPLHSDMSLWCTCGHQATTRYNRETHVLEEILKGVKQWPT